MPTTDINLNIDAITGVGSVNFVPKILTLTGPDGSPIVTVGNSMAYDDGITFTIENNVGGVGVQSKLIVNSSAAGGTYTEGGFISNTEAGYKYVRSQVFNGSILTSFELNEQHIFLKSPDIVDGYIAAFQDNGSGEFILISLPYPTGGGTTTNPLTIGTGLTGTSFDGSAPITIAIDSSVATLTGSQALSNKTGNISQWTNDSGYLTSLSGAVTSVAGTAGRITSSGGAAPIIDIDAAYVGQASITTLGTIGAGVWQGAAIADAYISSAATWNAKESPLTFGSGLTRTVNAVANDLITGAAGGQTIVSGTAATDKLIIKITTGNQTTGASNLVSIKSGNNGANELIRIGDGIGVNIGELSIWAAGQSSSSTHLLRAGTNFTYINAGTDLRLQVGAVNYINMLSGAGTVAIQKPVTFATGANVTLVAGSTTVAPLVFTSGTNKTTPTNGSMEYNGTNFFATRAGAVRENIVCASAVNTVSPTSPNRTITVNIDGTTFYIAAKTTND